MFEPQQKIFSLKEIQKQVHQWKMSGEDIVFTNGCFDILHPGHCDYLWKAKKLGTKLIVGLNADTSVQKIKGIGRPIQNQDARAVVLASLMAVDAVVLFEEETPISLIELITPDILVKGGDYTPEQVVGASWTEDHGGRLIILGFLPGYSTTAIEQKIKQHGNQ